MIPKIRQITVALEIPSQNRTDRMHWAKRSKLQRLWLVSIRAAAGRIEKATTPQSVVIRSYRKRLITDHANLVGGAKLVVDALVKAGLLVDDSDDWAEIEYRQLSFRNSPTGLPCTEFSIQPLTAGNAKE
jgi:hypothetical protein